MAIDMIDRSHDVCSHHDVRRGPMPIAESREADRVRLLLLISSLETGGAERQVVQLANQLPRDRFEVFVCSLSRHVELAADLHDREHRLHIMERRSRFDLSVVGRVAELIQRLRPHIVHAFLFDAEMIGRLAARSVGVPVVIASERNADYRIPFVHRLGHRLTRSMFDLLIANSEAGRRFCLREFGLPPSRVAVVRNGVDVDRFRPGNDAGLRARLGIPPDAYVVGMVAKFKRQKNHGVFLCAARQVLTSVPQAWFVCVGEPLRDNLQGAEDYHKEMHALMGSLNLADRCLLLGNRDDMPDVYRALDVVVLTSIREGTPNVLLEAMACGRPVVTTDVADNRLVVPDGEAGFIVPPNDVDATARRVIELADPAVRDPMKTAGRTWVEHRFSLQALARNTQEVYLQALARANGAVAAPVRLEA